MIVNLNLCVSVIVSVCFGIVFMMVCLNVSFGLVAK